jgi:ABC-2 type transport system permease protein
VKPSRFRRPLQIGTFLRKETLDVVRQPRMLLTMVFGPFLIMAIFGLGYRDEPKPMRTLFVAPAGSPFIERVQGYAGQIGDYVEYAGVTSDAASAERQLMHGDVDLVVTFPDDPLATVLQGERAPIVVQHTRLDPIERTAIAFASRLAVDQINSEVLASVVGEGQSLTRPAQDVFATADQAAAAFDDAVGRGDQQAATDALTELRNVTAQLSVSSRVATSLTERLGAGANPDVATGIAADVQSLRDTVMRMDPATSAETATGDVATIRQGLDAIQQNLGQITATDPAVLVRPFESDVDLAVKGTNQVTDWYAPAAVVLMLQQFGVAFGALSFVRERQLGITDVFRVAPVNAAQAVVGKYLAYLLVGSAIGAVLTALVVTVLDVKMAGSIGDLAIVMLLSLFASIGLGFVISLASSTDAQAVQYTMILLLASLFFSGFFLSLDQLGSLGRAVGWLLPVTYGMRMLRDVMLRDAPLDARLLAGLAAFGLCMFVLAWLATRRRVTGAR